MPLIEVPEQEAPVRTASAARPSGQPAYALWALVAVYVVVRAWNLTTFSLDWDEVFSVTTARLAFPELIRALVADLVHPPLFYVVLKGWMAIGGTTLLWVRLLPFAFSVAALAPLVVLFRQLELRPPVRMLALGFLAVSECLVFQARYVRMYSLLFLLGLASLALFFEWIAKGRTRQLVVLTAVNLLLVYTHYYAWLLIGVEAIAVALWWRSRLRQYAAATAALAAAFAPWATAVAWSARGASGLDANLRWITRPGWGDWGWFYAGLNGPLAPIPLASLVLAAMAVVLAAGLPRLIRAQRQMRLLVLAAVVPPAVSFAASHILSHSVWNARYLTLAVVPYIVLLACSLDGMRMRRAVITLVAAWLCWGAYRAAVRPEPQLDMAALAGQLAAHAAPDGRVTVYSLDPYLPAWMGYHLQPYGRARWDLVAIPTTDAAHGSNFWFAYDDKFGGRRPEDLLRARGYEVGNAIQARDEWIRIVIVPVRATSSPLSRSKRLPIPS